MNKKSLNRFIEPSILLILAKSSEPLHGYAISQQIAELPYFIDNKPDITGIYRTLKQIEKYGYVTSEWSIANNNTAKRLFTLTAKGKGALGMWNARLKEHIASTARLQSDIDALLNIIRGIV